MITDRFPIGTVVTYIGGEYDYERDRGLQKGDIGITVETNSIYSNKCQCVQFTNTTIPIWITSLVQCSEKCTKCKNMCKKNNITECQFYEE